MCGPGAAHLGVHESGVSPAPATSHCTGARLRRPNRTVALDLIRTTPGFSRTVTKAAVTGTTDFEVVATVNVRFSTLFPVLLPRLQTIDMSEQVKMRYECNPSIRPCSPPP